LRGKYIFYNNRNLITLFHRKDPKIYLYKDESLSQLPLPSGRLGRFLVELAKRNYDYTIYPKMNITMNAALYGLSLYLITNVFNLMIYEQPS